MAQSNEFEAGSLTAEPSCSNAALWLSRSGSAFLFLRDSSLSFKSRHHHHLLPHTNPSPSFHFVHLHWHLKAPSNQHSQREHVPFACRPTAPLRPGHGVVVHSSPSPTPNLNWSAVFSPCQVTSYCTDAPSATKLVPSTPPALLSILARDHGRGPPAGRPASWAPPPARPIPLLPG